MRRIHKNKVTLVSLRDSVTGLGSKSSWSGKTTRFWVKHENFKPIEIFVLEDSDPDPKPESGFAYAVGFIQ